MKVLVLGANGMLGHKLMQVLTEERVTVVGTVRHKKDPYIAKRYEIILDTGIDEASIKYALTQDSFDVVINCIGLVKQRMTVSPESTLEAIQTNSLFPHILASICKENKVRQLILLSTDCVFSGDKGIYVETDNPDPPDYYGRSKLLGEIPNTPGILTIRTSFIGKELSSKRGLLEWFLSIKKGEVVNGYGNARWNGLTTLQLARTISDIILNKPKLSGLYHIASSHEVNKWWILNQLNEILHLGVNLHLSLEPISFMTLDSRKFSKETGILIPDWYTMMFELVEDLYESYNYTRN